jgi:cation transport ATPase
MLRLMELIAWNETRSAGRGRTGALYSIARCGERWSVSVDGDVLCLVDVEEDARARTEYFEALRHVALARPSELSGDQLRHAEVVAREMKEAAREAAAGALPADEREAIDQYGRALGRLIEAIAAERARRTRAAPLHGNQRR